MRCDPSISARISSYLSREAVVQYLRKFKYWLDQADLVRLSLLSCIGRAHWVCLPQAELSESELKRVGLLHGHAYTMLQAIQLRSGLRLVELKNPCEMR